MSRCKTGCATKPGHNLPIPTTGCSAASSALGFSEGNVCPELVPQPLLQAETGGAHNGEALPAGAAPMVGAGALPRCAKARQGAGDEVGRRGTSTGREGGGGIRVLQPQTERAGFFPPPFFFLIFFPYLKQQQ